LKKLKEFGNNMFSFTKYKKIFFAFSGILVLASIGSILFFGLNLGIDFEGGGTLSVDFENERPNADLIKENLSSFNFEELHVRPVGEKGVMIQVKKKDLNDETRENIINELDKIKPIRKGSEEFKVIGPTIGRELKDKTKVFTIITLLAIVIYVAFAFRKISWPMPSWKYGISALIALFHDLIIPVGVFAVIGQQLGIQLTIPVVTALLTVLGYSINDTVVIFDRIRENLLREKGSSYAETVDISLNQILTRSIHTSVTTLLVLFAIFFFGGEALKYFALTLIIGIAAGTYSSIFLAGPVLVAWYNWERSS